MPAPSSDCMTRPSRHKLHKLLDAPLDRSAGAELLQEQLFRRFRDAILQQRANASAGAQLPSSREVAHVLGIARNTVLLAYQRLAAEGYVYTDGISTRVQTLTRAHAATPLRASLPLSATLARFVPIPSKPAHIAEALALRPGVPALDHFPMSSWRRCLGKALRCDPGVLDCGDPQGQPELRNAICLHLRAGRGLLCDPDQVVITEGASGALNLCARLLANPGDTVWAEDPGHFGARMTLEAAGLKIVPIRVDGEGLAVRPRDWTQFPPKLILTTPSHQYPLGDVMSIARRLDLIEQATRNRAWILEVDYDSDLHLAAKPAASLLSMMPHAPVIHVGTFSRTMFPSLHLGFLVLPTRVLPRARTVLDVMLSGGHRHEQLALADFMDSGLLARHLGRMRRLYRERQQSLRRAVERHLGVPHHVRSAECGLHLVLQLPEQYPDRAIVTRALDRKLGPKPLSAFTLKSHEGSNGLVLGYGNNSAEQFDSLLKTLSTLVKRGR